ncbi:serine hydrolase [Symbiobacterium thermophilum]|uniref:Beta-lactamase n=1 Tax=Symbiobacterium thermophilum (strain DSM 24528 / JCM 14929 / IAM 14863 / T) TaxID=292459 RepID=Q67QZ3_SYMTH|nr:serine hydrolase [Symbiobacterium thermophilum]BAD39900.1 beta-lactamase [Symbiobacterium thermophilum IAM 14863]
MTDPVSTLNALVAGFSGTMGVWARSLQTDEVIQVGASDDTFPSASTIKLAIFYEVMRQAGEGRLDLSEPRELRTEDKVPGCGVLRDLSPGIRLPLRDLATLMMIISDNTASNMCIDAVGIESVNRSMDELGLTGLRLRWKFFGAPAGQPVNAAVPSQLGRLMDMIVRRQVLTPEACDEMLRVMKQVQSPYAARYLPGGSQYDRPPEGPVIAAKFGSITGCRHEVGAVWKGGRGFVFSVMTKDCKDERRVEDNEGVLAVGRAVAILYRHFLEP